MSDTVLVELELIKVKFSILTAVEN